MCKCEYCHEKGAGVFFCERFRLYGNSRLTLCMLTDIEAAWKERLEKVPQVIRQRELDRLFPW